jgi:hypothetical protein
MVEEQNIVRNGKSSCGTGKRACCDNDASLGLLVSDCGDDLLYGMIADRVSIFFALDDDTNSIFCSDNIRPLIMRCLSDFSPPLLFRKKCGAEMFIFVGTHAFNFVANDLFPYQYGLVNNAKTSEGHKSQAERLRPEERSQGREEKNPDCPDAHCTKVHPATLKSSGGLAFGSTKLVREDGVLRPGRIPSKYDRYLRPISRTKQ